MKRMTMCILAFILVACGGGQMNGAVAPGQNGNFLPGVGVNQRLEIYTITGTVLGLGESIQRPESQGSAFVYQGSGSAYVQSSTPGKGFIRFHVDNVTWTHVPSETIEFEPVVAVGDNVLLKTSDTKAASLVAGDRTTFKCRVQKEFVEAVASNEQPTLNHITEELDYCRMETPKFTPSDHK